MARNSSTLLKITKNFFLTLLILPAFYGLGNLHAAAGNFEESSRPAPASGGHAEIDLGNIDFSLWSPARIKAYKENLTRSSVPPLAVLRIPRLRIVAPVLEGTDDLTLNSGVGRILGTAHLGQPGNVGIAGHRDSFFRALKNIAKGDKIELAASGRTDVYIVNKVYITQPSDVNALRSGPTPEITLVTCYPFYYLGNAPQRYIVQAVKTNGRTARTRTKSAGN